ncbi:periaxin-like isoform X2 [Lethenteron reissneri]|uniref:periaxin-like isoform X2 n=1 Tax=Lethenteron reissneri TaxID=7753 RepID=UPI002AB6741A|nr:periaxin-like isoform X2 [Lethenteron reissneri]
MATSDVSVTSGSVEEFDADEVVEVLLDKESSKAAAAGATGLEISGGKADGIYIKKIKKNTSAAKSHKIHEGDQILSATVYFDNMKYEDALKILQYSEPYQVGFRLKRKHGTAASDLEASSSFGSADVDVKGLRGTGQGDIHSKKHKKRAKANENVSGEDSEMKSPEIPDVELSMLKLPKMKKPQKSSSLRFSKSSSEYDEELQPQNEAGEVTWSQIIAQ